MSSSNHKKILHRKNFDMFLSILQQTYTVIAPTICDGAIMYHPIKDAKDLPEGWKDIQSAGKYKLEKRDDKALFGYSMSCDSWKKYLFPPRELLWKAKSQEKSFEITPPEEDSKPMAFMGVRSCELNAILIQDKIFMGGAYNQSGYQNRRTSLFLIAVNCIYASSNCFCTSMNTGPEVTGESDLILTEILTPEHYFIIEARTAKGTEILNKLPVNTATIQHENEIATTIKNTKQSIQKKMDTDNLQQFLYQNHENPHWEKIGEKCLACTNCTMVCPTCFCHTVEDVTDLSGQEAERWQKWDSCFNVDFSYIHGGNVRNSIRSRYRQWLTHKLASWIDQFGTSGCVGCGRCIAWCPAEIDITEEVDLLRKSGEQ